MNSAEFAVVLSMLVKVSSTKLLWTAVDAVRAVEQGEVALAVMLLNKQWPKKRNVKFFKIEATEEGRERES